MKTEIEHTIDISGMKIRQSEFMDFAVEIASSGVVIEPKSNGVLPCENPKILFTTNHILK